MSAGTLIDGAGRGEGWRAVDLFWEQFRVGEDVVVEDGSGGLHFGRLERPRDDEGIRVVLSRKRVLLDWREIVFVAHAGFPVRAIRGMTPAHAERLAARFDTGRARVQILRLLANDPPKARKSAPRPPAPRPQSVIGAAIRNARRQRRYISARGGCPFDFEDVEVVVLNNPGNDGPRWWGHGDEEELVLRARDGALCLSYNLGHLFYLETAGLTMGAA